MSYLHISNRQMETLTELSQRLGVPISICVEEAIQDWISNVASARIEVISQSEKQWAIIIELWCVSRGLPTSATVEASIGVHVAAVERTILSRPGCPT